MRITDDNLAADLAQTTSLMKRKQWPALARLASRLPRALEPELLPHASRIAFALGQLKRHREARELLEAIFALEASWRTASALAYVHYDAAMTDGRDVPKGCRPLDRETCREGFRKWIEVALRLRPESIKDLYRLGVFEAQVESRRDKPALRAFLAAIQCYRDLPERSRRGDLHKAYVRALYAGARSALRLGRVKLARRLAFACVREDSKSNFIAPLHRYDMAGRVCLASGELDHAERAFRIALDAKGPPRRTHIYARLAEVALERGDADAACRWIEGHIRPERRPAWIWRQLGDIHRVAGRPDDALACWQAAVEKDRGGKHLTWTRIADLHRERGDYRRAERTYRKAIEFARRRWSKEHRPALEALASLYTDRGKTELAEKLLAPPTKVRPSLGAAQRETGS